MLKVIEIHKATPRFFIQITLIKFLSKMRQIRHIRLEFFKLLISSFYRTIKILCLKPHYALLELIPSIFNLVNFCNIHKLFAWFSYRFKLIENRIRIVPYFLCIDSNILLYIFFCG